MKEKRIFLDLYKVTFSFIDCDNPDKVKKYGIDDYNGFAGVIAKKSKEGYWTIYLMINTKHKDFELDDLVHECVHATSWAFDSIGQSHNLANEEDFCYLTAWIFRQAYKYLI